MEKQSVRIIFQTTDRLPPENGEALSWESPPCASARSEAAGEYYAKGDAHYCLYEEQPEGWEKPCRVMLKWRASVLERVVRGDAASRMVFEPGKCHRAPYHTPYGDLLLETETHRLEVTAGQEGFLLLLEYGIRQGGQAVSEHRMEIRIAKL